MQTSSDILAGAARTWPYPGHIRRGRTGDFRIKNTIHTADAGHGIGAFMIVCIYPPENGG